MWEIFSEIRFILSLMNLTKINRQANIAYISVHAAPDLYSSLVYVVYIL